MDVDYWFTGLHYDLLNFNLGYWLVASGLDDLLIYWITGLRKKVVVIIMRLVVIITLWILLVLLVLLVGSLVF